MNIAFDTRILGQRYRYSGMHVYAANVLRELTRICLSQPDLTLTAFHAHGFHNGTIPEPRPGFTVLPTRAVAWNYVWRFGGADLAARRAAADVLFCPTHHSFAHGTVPLVSTIHDLTPIKAPSFNLLRNAVQRAMLWNAAHFSRHCITDSECSKKDMIEVYGLSPSRISVVYLGFDRGLFNAEKAPTEEKGRLLARLGINKPYVLHHGTVQPRKNLARLVTAFQLTRARIPDLDMKLVLIGPVGWNNHELLDLLRGPNGSDVILTGPLPDPELSLVLKGATICVIPSLYEGFCLPMVESMACGIPVITSNNSCLPEVSGHQLCYFDPWDVDSIAATLSAGLQDGGLRRRLTENGLQRAKELTWEKCARQILAILARVAAESSPSS